jgi:amino-acid N-acetyltransferase
MCPQPSFVHWFRNSAPYINAFRGKTFVIAFGGELLEDAQFAWLAHDVALLNSLGVRLVLVHGARPQIEDRLRRRGAEIRYVNGLRVTDDAALECVKEAAGTVRVEIEALLSMGLPNSPMAGARIRVASGNFVTARPLGIRGGVDYLHTGEVRRLDVEAINQHLAGGAIVLVSPLGYSPTGEVFNISAEEVATEVAVQVSAEKLIVLVDAPGLRNRDGELIRELAVSGAHRSLSELAAGSPDDVQRCAAAAVRACERGVRRCHLVDRKRDGALLEELFTRDGSGTLIARDLYEDTRRATIDDVGGLLELIAPLERDGALVRRSRELIEMEIGRFAVTERDGAVIGCAALYPFVEQRVAELACLVVHPDYANQGRGLTLLQYVEQEAAALGVNRLFVLTTRTAHWFIEHGFVEAGLDSLPIERRAMYNYQRGSKVFVKALD